MARRKNDAQDVEAAVEDVVLMVEHDLATGEQRLRRMTKAEAARLRLGLGDEVSDEDALAAARAADAELKAEAAAQEEKQRAFLEAAGRVKAADTQAIRIYVDRVADTDVKRALTDMIYLLEDLLTLARGVQ